jgi:FixJ family two-component response regulator
MARLATAFVVDGDPESAQSICGLIRQAKLPVRTFASEADFLREYTAGESGCLIIDLRTPEGDGLAIVGRLAAKGVFPPVIIVTGNGDVPGCVGAFKIGVLEFSEDMADEHELLSFVRNALDRNATSAARDSSWKVSAALSQLTRREKEIMEFLVAGKSIKDIAKLCGVAVQSVWKHQQHILSKFDVENVVELVQVLPSERRER